MTADAEGRAPEPTRDTGPQVPTPSEAAPSDAAPSEAAPSEESQSEGAQSEGAQSELDLGVLSTGSADVDRALAPLEGLAEREVSALPEVFEQVLDALAQTMTEAEPDVPSASD